MGSKGTNLRLSSDETSFLKDTSFFESKRKITQYIIEAFSLLELKYKETISSFPGKIPAAALSKSGKISRGENYLGLPYLVLDYPAHFDKKGVFAFRTMMWWGNPFSITFHISGFYLEILSKDLLEQLANSELKSILVCINENQWKHHHGTDNYIPIEEYLKLNKDGIIIKPDSFVKIALLIPIEKFDELEEKSSLFIKTILEKL